MSDKLVAIVLAAGQGKRMKSKVQKQYMEIFEKPVLFYSLQAFQESVVDEIILVTGKDEVEYCRESIVKKFGFTKVKNIVAGGKERFDSVYNGLNAVGECQYVFIHDGARPLLSQNIINKSYENVCEFKACVVGVKVKDTIKIADDQEMVEETPDRNKIWQIQTPQVFEFELIKKAYDLFVDSEEVVTDDAMVVEKMLNKKVKLVEGEYTNIKITTPEDIEIAKIFLKQ